MKIDSSEVFLTGILTCYCLLLIYGIFSICVEGSGHQALLDADMKRMEMEVEVIEKRLLRSEGYYDCVEDVLNGLI